MSMRPRSGAHGRLSVFGVIFSVAALAGCVTRQQIAPLPQRAPAARLRPSPLLGRAFDVVPAESRLTLLVYRAGPLAALGHNHVISCRCLTGKVYLPGDPLRASFDLRIEVGQLTVDDPELRAAEHSTDFPADVPQTAREGTRHNMLSAALLNAAKYPDITLRSVGLRSSSDGRPGNVVVAMLVQLDGRTRSIAVPMHYRIQAGRIVATGEFPLKQTDLGLTPFNAVGGALRVRDGMEVRLRVVASRASLNGPGRALASGAPCRAHCAP